VQCYTWTEGRGIFASGSPFSPVNYLGVTHEPGQGNNSYIFPGVGLGVIASESRRVTDEMFYVAARQLAAMVTEQDLMVGRLYPDLKRIREVSAEIATLVAEVAFKRGLTNMLRPADLKAHVRETMFDPQYPSYV
jgi:malate dehydrogenase (oxaloacetate-decarboxylating)(NADP+)